ncbi:MAG: preprotein translocase subunit YajC [Clostridia bacterium]|nr:preprotein translocase subunit YajC [Clostridia bacterium]
MITKLMNLLTDAADDAPKNSTPWGMYILIGVFVLLFVGMMFLNRRTQKKQQAETENMLNAIKPGNKVKTIGGICGIVVEVCPEDNTFVLETGTEASGKSYLKFDKQAVYQTDAVPTPVAALATPVAEKAEEAPVEAAAEEAPVEAVEEEKTEETKE